MSYLFWQLQVEKSRHSLSTNDAGKNTDALRASHLLRVLVEVGKNIGEPTKITLSVSNVDIDGLHRLGSWSSRCHERGVDALHRVAGLRSLDASIAQHDQVCG